ncbi:MAG: tetratricopeptide repeat protein [Gammaproteobacteria bacterium]|nr:tetratricopeptide repeat protein [Gammaproteobacteria bacterium]
MVDEYLSEREQAEQLQQWFRENWIWLLAGIVLGLGGVFGWRWWNAHQIARSQEAEQQFSAMLDALAGNQREEGLKIAGRITGEFTDTPYADQALLVLARLDIESGELEKAAITLRQVIDSTRDPELALIAGLRLARVQLAKGSHDDALATLAAIENRAVAARVAELRGDVMMARGQLADALLAYREAQSAVEQGKTADGLVDQELLRLKIDDLSATSAAE